MGRGFREKRWDSRAGILPSRRLGGSNRISPEDAYELWVQHNWWQHQREFDAKHAERLAAEMVVAVDLSIGIGPDNIPRVFNGQHTLWAIYLSGRTMQVSITIYMCRDNQGMANCYAIFDSNKTRSAATVLETYRKSGQLNISYPATRHHKWAQSVACAENDFSQPKRQQTNSAKMTHATRPEVVKFAEWMEANIENVNQVKGLLPMGIGACFYAMYRSDPVNAERFLKAYLSGAGLSENHPILIMRNRLTINKPPAEHGATASRLHSEIMYTCWRKFCLGEPLSSTRRTTRLPKWDDWRIYVAPPTATLVLGGNPLDVEVMDTEDGDTVQAHRNIRKKQLKRA